MEANWAKIFHLKWCSVRWDSKPSVSNIILLPWFHMQKFRSHLSSMIPNKEDKTKQGIENSGLLRQNPVKKKWKAVRLQSNRKNLRYVNKLKRTEE